MQFDHEKNILFLISASVSLNKQGKTYSDVVTASDHFHVYEFTTVSDPNFLILSTCRPLRDHCSGERRIPRTTILVRD